MKKHFSIWFAILIFTVLSIFARPMKAQDFNFSLNPQETRLLIEDSMNAHTVAKYALDTVGCIMQALERDTTWTPEECITKLREVLEPLGQEHQTLHPKVKEMLVTKENTRQS